MLALLLADTQVYLWVAFAFLETDESNNVLPDTVTWLMWCTGIADREVMLDIVWGVVPVSLPMASRIAHALGVPLADLLGVEGFHTPHGTA